MKHSRITAIRRGVRVCLHRWTSLTMSDGKTEVREHMGPGWLSEIAALATAPGLISARCAYCRRPFALGPAKQPLYRIGVRR